MKFASEVEINLPIDVVTKLFIDPKNLQQWMDGLEGFEQLTGKNRELGSTGLMILSLAGRNIEMIETITVNNLPHEFSGTYITKGINDTAKNLFEDLGNNRTKYTAEHEIVFSGMIKLIAGVVSNQFKKQSDIYLQDFKKFAEKQA